MFFPEGSWLHNPYVQFALSTPVFAWGGFLFGKSAWNSLRSGVPNMDVLIIVGSSAAYIYSIIGWIQYGNAPDAAHYLFFETAASIITLVTLGNFIEHRSVKQTTSALRELRKLQRVKAQVRRGHNWEPIDASELVQGDVFLLRSGDDVPMDGTLIRGMGTSDEKLLTGESDWVQKKVGDSVFAGTQWMDGSAEIQVVNDPSNSALARIIKVMEDAQQNPPEIQQLGDRVSAVFVPIVVGISFLTVFLSGVVFELPLSQSIMRGIAVLVISCPCAMGLATPTAVMVGLGRAAKIGVLVKGGRTLEALQKASRVVIDKTGTLTTGNFRIDHHVRNTAYTDRIPGLVVGLEEISSHPIAQSLLLHFAEQVSEAEVFYERKEEKGMGISGKTESGEQVFIGRHPQADQFDLALFVHNEIVAEFRLQDELRPGIDQFIQTLRNAGKKVILLSGDRTDKCEQIAKNLNFDEIYAEQTPFDKLDKIETWNKLAPTIMIGDGINDAPALAKAYVGISFGHASQIAVNSASVVVINPNPFGALTELLKLSKLTYSTIVQNLFWAFFYNVLAIPIAGLGFLSPMIAAMSMAFSDVMVIGNSLRLKWRSLSSRS